MQRTFGVPAVLAAMAAIVGCADSPVQPVSRSAPTPQATTTTGPGTHLVVFKAGAVPTDFATKVAALGGTVERELRSVGAATVNGLSDAALATLQSDALVSVVEPEMVHALPDARLTANPVSTDVGPASPADPATAFFFPRQWHLRAIGADRAWTAGLTGAGAVTVAILDTGIGYTHADLAGRVDLARSVSFVPADDAYVLAFFPGAHLIADIGYHGTHVAATVASNAVAAGGVTSRTTLMGVKVCSVATGGCPSGAVFAGIQHAVENGANIINMSLAGAFQRSAFPGYVAVLNRLFGYARQRGVTVVVAAGNAHADLDRSLYPDENGVLTHYPSLYATYCTTTHNICVSATGPTSSAGVTGPWTNVDAPASYSNFGRSVINVAAPGGTGAGPVWAACSPFSLVVPVCQTGTYVVGLTGTSMATPHVAGVAALIMAQQGILPPSPITSILQQTADDLGIAGTDPFYGKGRINAARALGVN